MPSVYSPARTAGSARGPSATRARTTAAVGGGLADLRNPGECLLGLLNLAGVAELEQYRVALQPRP